MDNYKILVVEDDDSGYMLIHEVLSLYPVELYRAENGQEAIDNFKDNKVHFDLVLMDIRLPKMNGYEATLKIKEINPSIPIIAVSALAHQQGINDSLNSGCNDFIAKPYDLSKFINKIQNYLNFKVELN